MCFIAQIIIFFFWHLEDLIILLYNLFSVFIISLLSFFFGIYRAEIGYKMEFYFIEHKESCKDQSELGKNVVFLSKTIIKAK